MIEPADLIKKLLNVVQESDILKEEDIEPFYSYAFAQYQSGGFERAAEVFHVLCVRKPLDMRFWFGLAATLQEGQNYEKALYAWAMTALLDQKNPYPHFHAAECSLSLNNIGDAKLALKETENRIGGNHPLQDRIPLLKEVWDL
jgi:type III secretion system low calcium response chaperone LcrH/SycD